MPLVHRRAESGFGRKNRRGVVGAALTHVVAERRTELFNKAG